jgi:hypothetical protein
MFPGRLAQLLGLCLGHAGSWAGLFKMTGRSCTAAQASSAAVAANVPITSCRPQALALDALAAWLEDAGGCKENTDSPHPLGRPQALALDTMVMWWWRTPGGCKDYSRLFPPLDSPQALALDALAAWLEEDAGRLQPRLAQRDTLARLAALLASHTPAGAPPLTAPTLAWRNSGMNCPACCMCRWTPGCKNAHPCKRPCLWTILGFC